MKSYLVVGLGRFGLSIAQTLYEADSEVLAIDTNEELIQEAINNNIIDNALILDATDENALKEIGASNFDIAFVGIGSNIQGSIMTTLNLKELGVKKIIAKALTKSHGKVLKKIGADEVIYPEEYMGHKIAMLAMEPNMMEHMRFSKDFLLVEFKAPSSFWGKNLMELGARDSYNINIVGIKKSDGELNSSPRATSVIEKGDTLLVITDSKTSRELEKLK
ncbi:MAG: potassium transporter KtrA [Fusobacteriia bacterium 4572_74]|nr:MAG: potassium transporter KtrA [Fusobacteriia bacterium 4572_74]